MSADYTFLLWAVLIAAGVWTLILALWVLLAWREHRRTQPRAARRPRTADAGLEHAIDSYRRRTHADDGEPWA